mmetsp:Transcript_46970/g.89675  ORF Transcript_46970/g.89675 Transcript_46970/m.89675 type:complete len:202 (+) Transcript_46970:245-850(+)
MIALRMKASMSETWTCGHTGSARHGHGLDHDRRLDGRPGHAGVENGGGRRSDHDRRGDRDRRSDHRSDRVHPRAGHRLDHNRRHHHGGPLHPHGLRTLGEVCMQAKPAAGVLEHLFHQGHELRPQHPALHKSAQTQIPWIPWCSCPEECTRRPTCHRGRTYRGRLQKLYGTSGYPPSAMSCRLYPEVQTSCLYIVDATNVT